MQLRVVSIFCVARQSIRAQFRPNISSGIFTSVEPVLSVNLTLGELTSAVGTVLATEEGHPHLPNPTRDEAQKRNDPVLMAAKASTLKERMSGGGLEQDFMEWQGRRCRICHVYDKKGRWEFDPAKVRVFPLDTPLGEVLAVVLEDIRSRPELQSTEEA